MTTWAEYYVPIKNMCASLSEKANGKKQTKSWRGKMAKKYSMGKTGH